MCTHVAPSATGVTDPFQLRFDPLFFVEVEVELEVRRAPGTERVALVAAATQLITNKNLAHHQQELRPCSIHDVTRQHLTIFEGSSCASS